jgi:hypothetical protein
MTKLRREIGRRFPEVRGKLRKEDEPYTLMARVAEWLRAAPRETITRDVVHRLRDFMKWCDEQRRTDSAADDLFTISIVGFWEPLFDSDSTRFLIPQLMSRQDVESNEAYLKAWVGEENYRKALDAFTQSV